MLVILFSSPLPYLYLTILSNPVQLSMDTSNLSFQFLFTPSLSCSNCRFRKVLRQRLCKQCGATKSNTKVPGGVWSKGDIKLPRLSGREEQSQSRFFNNLVDFLRASTENVK
jgi:hypothetical protein